MKRIYIAVIVACSLGWATCGCAVTPSAPVVSAVNLSSSVENAFKDRKSNVQVEGAGKVIRLLPDDLEGSRHQRFIIRLASGQTLLIVHNIDMAPRVVGLKKDDSVRFYGEYVWNEKGGMVHWTHHDPKGHHAAGWVKHNGRTYQ